MKRVFLILGLIVATACGSSPTTPDPVDVQGWGGTVTFSQVVTGGFEATVAWQGTVFWTDDSLLADLKTGATAFVVKSASVSASYNGTAPCPAHGSVSVAEVSIDPQKDSTLVVQADGSYAGSFHAVATILVTTSNCPYPVVPPPTIDATYVGLDLKISGKANGSSLKGDMAPVIIESTTYKGSWEFTALATSRASAGRN